MEIIFILIVVGFFIGTLGTLIGAGGGFLLVPVLLITEKNLSPESITAISMAVVAANAISGSVAYMRSRRVDYKAGIYFAAFTIPGSILGVLCTRYIPRHLFDVIFAGVLIIAGIVLFIKGGNETPGKTVVTARKGWVQQRITDKWEEEYVYAYDRRKGAFLSLLVGFVSPMLGIGGGIIHVPALAEWLLFPVHIATATSHFILAIMATVSVLVHIINGNYNDPVIFKMVAGLIIGVIPGAQLGAYLSRHFRGKLIIKVLALCLVLVGLRIIFMH